MGEIVVFQQSHRRSGARSAREIGSGAEILFFTGVRYERDYVAAPEIPPRKSARPGQRARRAKPA